MGLPGRRLRTATPAEGIASELDPRATREVGLVAFAAFATARAPQVGQQKARLATLR